MLLSFPLRLASFTALAGLVFSLLTLAPLAPASAHPGHGDELGGSASASAGKGPKFLYKDKKGRVARYNPCKPITWAYNGKGARKGGMQDTRTAVKRVSKYTGIKFRYIGRTKARPFKDKHPKADILIGWGSPKTHPKFFSKKTLTAGVGGSRYSYRIYPSGKRGAPEYISGDIVVDKSKKFTRKLQLLIFIHELGHVMGLAHVKDKKSLMDPKPLSTRTSVKPTKADLKGFKRVGRPSGCIPNPIR